MNTDITVKDSPGVNVNFQPTLTEAEYRCSRFFFLIEGCTGMVIWVLTSGAFLAGFINYLGANDSFNGIIAALPVLFGLTQLFAPFFLEKLEHRKPLTITLAITYRLILGIMFLIPLFTGNWKYNPVLAAVIFGLASFLCPFFNLAVLNWIMSLAPENIRGKYLALKDALSYGFLTIITIGMGWMLDFYKDQGRQDIGFSICGIVIIILAIINYVALLFVKEPAVPVTGKQIKPWEVLKEPLRNVEFRKIIFLYVLWNFGFHFSAPFINVYLVTGLKLDYTYIMILGFLTNAMRVLTAPFWGRLADRRSWELTTKFSLLLLGVSLWVMFLINQATVDYLYPIYAIISGIAWGGVGISIFCLQFNYAPITGRTIYLAANASLGGLTGFSGALFSSFLLGLVGNKSFQPLNFHFGGMQLIFILSGCLLAGSALYIHYNLQGRKLAASEEQCDASIQVEFEKY